MVDLLDALREIERLANEARDDAIDNRGHVIGLEEAVQFERIAAIARSALASPS
jgi:hypothetical protein